MPDKKGVCQSCGKIAFLRSCSVCGAPVCSDCLLEYGCKICRGKVRIG